MLRDKWNPLPQGNNWMMGYDPGNRNIFNPYRQPQMIGLNYNQLVGLNLSNPPGANAQQNEGDTQQSDTPPPPGTPPPPNAPPPTRISEGMSQSHSQSYLTGPLNQEQIAAAKDINKRIRERNDKMEKIVAENYARDKINLANYAMGHQAKNYDDDGKYIGGKVKTLKEAIDVLNGIYDNTDTGNMTTSSRYGGSDVPVYDTGMPVLKAKDYSKEMPLPNTLYKTLYRSDSESRRFSKGTGGGGGHGPRKIVYGSYYGRTADGRNVAIGEDISVGELTNDAIMSTGGEQTVHSMGESYYNDPRAIATTHFKVKLWNDKHGLGKIYNIKANNENVTGVTTPLKYNFFSHFKIVNENGKKVIKAIDPTTAIGRMTKYMSMSDTPISQDELREYKEAGIIDNNGRVANGYENYIKNENGRWIRTKLFVNKRKMFDDVNGNPIISPRAISDFENAALQSAKEMREARVNSRKFFDTFKSNISLVDSRNRPISHNKWRQQKQMFDGIHTTDWIGSVLYGWATSY